MRRGELWLYAAIGITAAILCLAVTRHRVGFDSDSSAYLGTAQNVLDGHGVTTPFPVFTSEYSPREAESFHGAIPLAHYPPLYPVTLAGIAATGTSVEFAARLLGASLLGVG